jgi:hypothetical protein
MPMMNIQRFLYVFVIAIGCACSGVRVLDTEADTGFRLGNYKTFDFFIVEGSGDTTENFDANAQLIMQAISRELQSRGLQPNGVKPDLLVNIGIVVREKVQTRETNIREAPRYIGQRRYSWKSEQVEVGRYKEGTVTVDLVDRVENNLVWKGVVEGTIPTKKEKIEPTINKGVSELFERL